MSAPFNGFSEPSENYFRLPNTWFEIIRLLRDAYGSRFVAALKMLEYILRHTWGYRRFDGSVRLTAREIYSGRKHRGRQIDRGTGLVENSVQKAGEALHKLGLVEITYEEADQARRVRTYRPRMAADEGEIVEPVKEFTGFDNPQENYFKVPSVWTDITRGIGSAATILAVEYLFRHGWGYGNPNGVWMDVDDVANGRKYVTSSRRYDQGIGFDLSTTYRALNEATTLGIVVWADKWENTTVHRIYNLRLKDMPVGLEGRYAGALPWDERKEETAPSPDGIGANEVGICNLEEEIGYLEGESVGVVEEVVGANEEIVGVDEEGNCAKEVSFGVDEARTASPHTLTDTFKHS